MATYPLVIVERADATPNFVLRHNLNMDTYWEGLPKVLTLSSEDFASALPRAMQLIEMEYGPTWFWLVDNRYSLETPMSEWSTPYGNTVCVYKAKSHLDEPLDGYGGVYWLPSLSKALKEEFQYFSSTLKQDLVMRLPLQDDFSNWPYKVINQTLVRKITPYDVFVLHYDESAHMVANAGKDVRVILRVPHVRTQRSQVSIYDAHRNLADKSTTDIFVVVDADLKLYPDLITFPRELHANEKKYVHLWRVENPINGLTYGHGGPKMFHKDHFTARAKEGPDTTLSVGEGLTIYDEVVGVHAFNWSEFSTWRTAVREVAKLSKKDDNESKERLKCWLTKANPNAEFSSYCLAGAKAGVFLALQSVNMGWINNYAFLRELFDKEFAT
jgi:hypothetical protein